MSERKWTKAQRAAIEDEGGSLLIDAAAGSGKTAVLVERAVRMMTREENPVPADKMLILTFTNAAAEELRVRLAKRLDEQAQTLRDNLFFRRQKNLLQRAFIGTIDAFCQQLVREWFAQLDVAPDVSVGQEALLSELSEQALQEALEEAYENKAFAQFSALYGRSRSDEEAAKAMESLYRYVCTLPWPLQQLEHFAALYEQETPLCESLWGKELFAHAERSVSGAKTLAKAALQLARDDGGLDAWLPMLQEECDTWQHLEQLVKERRWDACELHLRTQKRPSLASVRGYEGEGKERVQAFRKLVKGIAEELLKHCFVCTEQEHREDMETAAPMVRALCRATARYAELYMAKKTENKILDFADFEHLALGLLMSQEGERLPAAEEISTRYEFVMVDEYQDTNELQSALYTCLGNRNGSNLFYVGDVKQSIYRFRRANPGLFLEKKKNWAAYESGQKPAVLRLGHNFRSGPGVVEGVNSLFEELMSEALGDVAYSEGEQLIQGGSGSIRDGLSLVLLQKKEDEDEARYVAKTIAIMIQERVPVQDGTQQRPCRFGDFCILLRARSAMATFEQALREAHIPVNSDRAQELLCTPEVLPLRAVLSAIDNPGDDVHLAATMLGPLFRFTPDELAALRLQQADGSLYGALLCSSEEKCKDFVQTLAHFRALSKEMPLGRFCEELVLRTGYLSAVAAMEDGMVRRENVRRFLSWAAQMGTISGGGLAGFVRLLCQGRGPQNAGYQNRPGAVSLLTAHKSKGLEFPIVFFADTGHQFNLRDQAQRVQFHTQFGIGFRLRAGQIIYPTLPFLAIRRRSLQESLSEEMRVLYVALTRAKDRLQIVYAHKDPLRKLEALAALAELEENRPYLIGHWECFGDWVFTAMLRHEQAAPLWQAIGRPRLCPGKEKETQCPVNISIQTVEACEDAPEQTVLNLKAEDEAVKKLKEHFSAVLPRQALQEVPRKLSVSALTKTEQAGTYKRPSLLYENGLTAAERGTAMHRFLQLANFAAAEQNREQEIKRLEAAKLLSPVQAASVNRKELAKFFSSPLFARMRAAVQVLREYDFITAIPAGRFNSELEGALAKEPVYLQGIADAVILQENSIEIVDYKTDRGKTAQKLREVYENQLNLYAKAVQKRLGLPVTRLTIWSFALCEEVAVPFLLQEDGIGENPKNQYNKGGKTSEADFGSGGTGC